MLCTASILVMPCWQLYYCTLISVHPLHSISWNVAVLQKKPRTLPSLETICLWSMNYGLGKGVVWTCCCFFNPYTQRIDCDQGCVGRSSNDDGNINEENGKKNNRLRLAKQWLYMCVTYFCTFFCHRLRCENA